MEGQRLLSGYACGRVRLLELFQMPPRSIRSDDRNACTSSSEVPQGKLAKRAVKCHLLAVFWVTILVRKSGILIFEHLRPGLPKSDPKYGARGRSARRLVLWEKIAQPSGPYHRTRQDVKPQAPSCPVLRKPRVLAHRGRKVGPMAVG